MGSRPRSFSEIPNSAAPAQTFCHTAAQVPMVIPEPAMTSVAQALTFGYIRHVTNEGKVSRLSPERRRAEIVKVAARHFSRDGVADASMSAIARESGVTRALVYHYFSGKSALLDAVLRREADRLLAATAPDPERSPRENLEQALGAFFDHYAASAGGVRELYAPTHENAPVVADLISANHSVQVERVIAVSRTTDSRSSRAAAGAWLAFVEYLARAAGEDPLLPRAQLVGLCRHALEAALGHPLPES